ncbi:hypothetical protein ONZ45_g10990 [Pleurotus djamor]|nr:hypothetical protein ONZ45_g10990 [Pleurotus djamor]
MTSTNGSSLFPASSGLRPCPPAGGAAPPATVAGTSPATVSSNTASSDDTKSLGGSHSRPIIGSMGTAQALASDPPRTATSNGVAFSGAVSTMPTALPTSIFAANANTNTGGANNNGTSLQPLWQVQSPSNHGHHFTGESILTIAQFLVYDPLQASLRELQESTARFRDAFNNGRVPPSLPSMATTTNPPVLPVNSTPTVDVAARFNRLEKQLELLNPVTTQGAQNSATLTELGARFDRLEKRLEDLVKGQVNGLDARFDHLEQRVEQLGNSGASHGCGSCAGLTITIKHEGSN